MPPSRCDIHPKLGKSPWRDHGISYGSSFSPTAALDVKASIRVEPGHVGKTGNLYLILGLGQQFFMRDSSGKDHWPIGSAILIKQGASWGNRVVGATDAMHNALKINPTSLKVDSGASGVKLEPKHLQQAMRQLGGLENSSVVSIKAVLPSSFY